MCFLPALALSAVKTLANCNALSHQQICGGSWSALCDYHSDIWFGSVITHNDMSAAYTFTRTKLCWFGKLAPLVFLILAPCGTPGRDIVRTLKLIVRSLSPSPCCSLILRWSGWFKIVKLSRGYLSVTLFHVIDVFQHEAGQNRDRNFNPP